MDVNLVLLIDIIHLNLLTSLDLISICMLGTICSGMSVYVYTRRSCTRALELVLFSIL